jgi:hypothetical protein
MKTRSGWFFVFLMMIIIFAEGRAYAYIDPGTGSMLWQLLFAAGVGSLFYLRKAIAWVGRLRAKRKSDGAQHSAGTLASNPEEKQSNRRD